MAADLIHQLLRKEPENRLGNLRNGVDDVMAHPWFHNFSWDHMLEMTLPAPYVPPEADLGAKAEPSRHGSKKTLDLSDAMTSPTEYGFWPGW